MSETKIITTTDHDKDRAIGYLHEAYRALKDSRAHADARYETGRPHWNDYLEIMRKVDDLIQQTKTAP